MCSIQEDGMRSVGRGAKLNSTELGALALWSCNQSINSGPSRGRTDAPSHLLLHNLIT